MASRPRAAALGLLLVASLAGCVSMPTGGPVLSYPVTASPGGQSQVFMQQIPQAPQATWGPTQIVQGFLVASGTLGAQQTARQYLTPQFSKTWDQTSQRAAIVYSNGPNVATVSITKSDPKAKGRRPQTAVVKVTGTVQANLLSSGSYAVPSAKAPQKPQPLYFTVMKEAGGPWRIIDGPTKLLLTSDQFKVDYQQRNLYFFDPAGDVLVPDPVYVPLLATPSVLINNLVTDLISPPRDWLSHATSTAFPPSTKVGGVTLAGGTATVSLTGADIGRATPQVKQQVTSQLLLTLPGSGQGGPTVKSVELVVNGKPWIAPNAQGNPIQSQAVYQPPQPAPTGEFFYLDGAYLQEQRRIQDKPSAKFLIGKGFTQIAVSPPQPGGVAYLAALRGGPQGGGALYTGPVGGKLVKRGTGFTSMSWAPDGDLWTTSGAQIFMLRGDASPAQPAGQPVPVNVVNSSGGSVPGPFTALRVAPDGVRMAIIVKGATLNFGAINRESGAKISETTTRIVLSPFSVDASGSASFSSVTWYGPYDVITLGAPGPPLTEYPVNGGGSTLIPPPASPIPWVTASEGWPLIAVVAKGEMSAAASLAGAWGPVGDDATSSAKGLSPVYPG